MTIGTKSVLFGAHQFLLHPWFVAAAWWRLYGFPWDPRLWIAFFVHDLGYVGKPNMDGPEGETHPLVGAHLMALFDGHIPIRSKLLVSLGYSKVLPTWETRAGTVAMGRWALLSLLHSRYYAKSLGFAPSRLCIADKLAIALTPAWLYLPMVRLTGEAREYMTRESRQGSKHWTPEREDVHRWYRNVQTWCAEWAYAHRDCPEDTWTPDAV